MKLFTYRLVFMEQGTEEKAVDMYMYVIYTCMLYIHVCYIYICTIHIVLCCGLND